MRALNIVGGSIVLVCVVAVSYSHTLALFGMGGFTGIFQHMAVIAVEVTFLLGALNMVVSRFKGQHPGIPAIIGGLFGVGIVGWGNVEAGVNYGLHGVLLGAAIPISLIIAEAILSKAILQRMKDHPEVTQDGELSPSDSPNQWEDSQDTSTEQKEPPKNNPVPPIDNEESTREEKETAQAITQESPTIETDPEIIYGVAWEMYEKNGEPPTRRGLAEAANTTEHRARKAIDRLKAELEQQREVVA